MATPGMLLSQFLGIVLLLIVLWLLYTKFTEFPEPLTIAENPKRELFEIAILFSITFTLSTIYWLWGLPSLSLNPVISFSLNFFESLALLGIIELGIHRRTPKDLGLTGFNSKGRFVALFLIAFTMLWGVLKILVGFPGGPQSIGVLLYYILIPAFIEEWEFRSIYQTKIERALGQEKAWLLGGVIFGLMHIPADFFGYWWFFGGQDLLFSFLALGLQITFGWVFGVAFIKMRSIWTCIIAHYLFDFMAVLILTFL